MCFSLDVCAESLILCYSVSVAKQAEFSATKHRTQADLNSLIPFWGKEMKKLLVFFSSPFLKKSSQTEQLICNGYFYLCN